MRNGMVTFVFEGRAVRVVGTPEAPEWVAQDVAEVLDLGNVHSSLALLPDDEKGLHTVETLGGPQEVATLKESGLYRLIFRSRKEEAERLRRFVFHEVLPAIRRTGGYGSPAALAAVEARVAALEAKLAAPAPLSPLSPLSRPLPARRVRLTLPADRRYGAFRDPHFDPDTAPVPELRYRVHPHAAPHLRELLGALRDTVGTEGVAVADGFVLAPRLAVALRAFGDSAARVGQVLSRCRGFRHENLVLDYGRAKRAGSTFDAPAKRTSTTWRARVVVVEAKPAPVAPRERFLFGEAPTAAELERAAQG